MYFILVSFENLLVITTTILFFIFIGLEIYTNQISWY